VAGSWVAPSHENHSSVGGPALGRSNAERIRAGAGAFGETCQCSRVVCGAAVWVKMSIPLRTKPGKSQFSAGRIKEGALRAFCMPCIDHANVCSKITEYSLELYDAGMHIAAVLVFFLRFVFLLAERKNETQPT